MFCFFFQAEDGIRDAQESRGLGDVYKRQEQATSALPEGVAILDEAYHIEWCNPLAERHFGLDLSLIHI